MKFMTGSLRKIKSSSFAKQQCFKKALSALSNVPKFNFPYWNDMLNLARVLLQIIVRSSFMPLYIAFDFIRQQFLCCIRNVYWGFNLLVLLIHKSSVRCVQKQGVLSNMDKNSMFRIHKSKKRKNHGIWLG